MDEEKIRLLVERAAQAAVERLIATGMLGMPQRSRLSQIALEQRRAAAAVSAERRRKLYAARDKRRTKKQRPVDGARERKQHIQTDASAGTVNGRVDSINGPVGAPSPEPTTPAAPPDSPGQTATARAWLRYASAYKLRWGAFPPGSARANGMLSQLVARIGAPEAPDVSEFYVRHDDALYVKAQHPLTLLLRDAEKLRTQWATKRKPNGPVPGAAWWEIWSGIQEQGRELGVPDDDNPTTYRFAVLRAAAAWGSLPYEVAEKLGLHPHEPGG